ncbi:general substrate transporter [Flagelloscypha sp. PMI_526]|nr:general substrate transporter [Flagelloscypha sp. PMI_526]
MASEKTSAAPQITLGVSSAPKVTEIAMEDTIPWYQKKNLRNLYLIMIPSCLGVEMTSGYDASMVNGLQLVPTWQSYFNHPRTAILGLISSMYSLGAICSLPFVPFVTDRFGRKRGILIGSILMIIGAILQTASQNFAMFLVSRWILGTGIPMSIVGASSLIGELSHPRERERLGSLFNASYFPGSIVAAGVTFGTFSMKTSWGWRIPSLLQILPSLMQIASVWFLPESPRWLISKGREDEARAVLIKYHAEGDENDPLRGELVKVEMVMIKETLELELQNKKRSWKELIATAGMRRRLIIASFLGLFTQWSGNGLTSYFLGAILENVGVTSAKTKNQINVANTAWGMINAMFFAFAVHKLKRRTGYLTGTISLLVVFTAWTAASARYAETKSHASSIAVIFLIFLYSPCYNICYNALTYTFLVELFPFAVRARGIAIFQWWGRGATFFNQFVNPIGIGNAGWKYYISYVVFLAFEVVFVYFMFPETSGRTLEELAFLFEDDERAAQEQRVAQDIREIHNEAGETTGSIEKASKEGSH